MSNVTKVHQQPTAIGEFTEVGISGLDTVTEEQFFEIGKRLTRVEHGLQWAIGDWYNAIPWGDKVAACREVGINPLTAERNADVCRAFKIPTRGGISFTHHRVLTHSGLTESDRKLLLKKAEIDRLSSAALKIERDIILGIAPMHPTKDYDSAVGSLADAVREAMPTAPKAAVNAAVKGMGKVARDLKHEFTDAVDKAAEAKAKAARENMKKAQRRADEQYEKAVKMAAGVKAFLTKKEFQMIRACLHPDYCSHPKSAEAFDAFNKLADIKNW